jgi:hypothetical protein
MSGQASQRSTCLGWILPDHLLNEYGLRIVDLSRSVDPADRRIRSIPTRFFRRRAGRLSLSPPTKCSLSSPDYLDRPSLAMSTMLDRLPGLDPTDPPSGECRRYFVDSSERILLGPVSLAKFAEPSLRSPSPLFVLSAKRADELLAGIRSDVTPMSFDPVIMSDGPMTRDDAMASTFIAWTLGFLIAAVPDAPAGRHSRSHYRTAHRIRPLLIHAFALRGRSILQLDYYRLLDWKINGNRDK